MADRLLHVADDLALPIDAVTETFLIFGKRGSGKTSTASVFTEELIGAGLPVGVIDPMGAWWGLRSSADGQGPGLPVTILGGEHADLPLHPGSGAAVADLLVSERLPVVLDLFLMSKTQQRAFVTDFMETLFRANREPLHLVIDEADRFAPQRGGAEMARLLGAYEDIVLRGRKPGIGSTSITLRPAALHSAIRSQVEALIAMRLLGKLDVAAIDEWIRLHASDEDARELKASLPSLPVGTAWIWSPGWLEMMRKIQVRPRRTFDSSATPRVGQKLIVPRQFAPVNPADLERMAALLQRNDEPVSEQPSAEVATLRRELASVRAQLAEAQNRPAERVEVPVFAPGQLAGLGQSIDVLREVTDGLLAGLSRAMQASTAPAAVTERTPAPPRRRHPRAADVPSGSDQSPTAQAVSEPGAEDPRPLKAGERNMLATLARMRPMAVTRAQLGALSGFASSGGTFKTYLNTLRRQGLAAVGGSEITITEAGFAAAGAESGKPMTRAEIRGLWHGALKAGERAMLDVLIGSYPSPVSRPDLAAQVSFEATGGTFKTYINTLKRNMLAEEGPDGIRAADVFFLTEVSDGA